MLTFTLVSPTNTPAVVSELKLKTDTGPDAADGKTTDPDLVGAVANADGDSAYLAVEFDEDGDGKADGITFADYQGKFEYRPADLRAGAVTVKARAVEFDPLSNSYVRGDWVACSSTLELDTTAGSGVPTADGMYAATLGEAAAAYNAAVGGTGGATGGRSFNLAVGTYEGAQGFGDTTAAANATPLSFGALAAAPTAEALDGTFSIGRSGADALTLSGTWSRHVTVSGNHFVVNAKVVYTYSRDQKTTNGGETTTLHQDGTYQLVYYATGTFAVSGGVVTITGGMYDSAEAASSNSTYAYVNNYSSTGGGFAVAGTITADASGNDKTDRSDHGSFALGTSGATATGTYKLNGSGVSSDGGSSSATYVSSDPRSSGGGTANEKASSEGTYSFSEAGDSYRDPSGASVTGTLTFDVTNSATDDLDYAGSYSYAYGGTAAAGTFAMQAGTATTVSKFHYSGTFSATDAGLSTTGDYQREGTSDGFGKYHDAGTYAVSQSDYASTGSYLTDQQSTAGLQFTEAMHFESGPSSTLVAGGYAVHQTGSTTLANTVASTYAGSAGGESCAGTLAQAQTSTETILNSANTGTYWATDTQAKADGTYAQTVASDYAITYVSSGSSSRPSHSTTFAYNGTRSGTGYTDQLGAYHIDDATNVSTGTFNTKAANASTQNSSNTTDDTDLILGATNHRTTSSTSHAVASDSTAYAGTFAGSPSNTAWAGTYATTDKLAWDGTYNTNTTYSGPDQNGSVATTWSGTNGFDNSTDGGFTRDNTSKTVDGNYKNSNSSTGKAHVASAGSYNLLSPGGSRSGSFVSVEDTTSTFAYADAGTLTVRNQSVTRAGQFDQTQTTLRDTDDGETFTYASNSGTGRLDSGTTATTGRTHYDAWGHDAGAYADADGKLTSSGTVADKQATDAANTRDNTNHYDYTTAGTHDVGTTTNSERTVVHSKTTSTVDYWRDPVGTSQSGKSTDWTDLTVGRKDSDAGTSTNTPTVSLGATSGMGAAVIAAFQALCAAKPVTTVSSTWNTYDSHEVTSASTKFTQGGGYGNYTGPTYPGAGSFTATGRDESGHVRTSSTVDTARYDSFYRDSPNDTADGSQPVSGYASQTGHAASHVTFQESADLTRGAAGAFRSGTFARATATNSDTATGSSATAVNKQRTNRGTTTSTRSEWVTNAGTTAETGGTFAEAAPANGAPTFTRSAHVQAAGTVRTTSIDYDYADFEHVGDPVYGPDSRWSEDGQKTTTRDQRVATTETADYTDSSAGSSRAGATTQDRATTASTVGRWRSTAERHSGPGTFGGGGPDGGRSFGLFAEFGFGYAGNPLLMYSGGAQDGSPTQSAGWTETWNDSGSGWYHESATFSSQSGGVGTAGGTSTRSGSFSEHEQSKERWGADDADDLLIGGSKGTIRWHYAGSGKRTGTHTSDDAGSFATAGGVTTTTGVKSNRDTSRDAQSGGDAFGLGFGWSAGTDHHWGSASGWAKGSSVVTGEVSDTGAGYTQTQDGSGAHGTRTGGRSFARDTDEKHGSYGEQYDFHGSGQILTWTGSGSGSGSGSSGPTWAPTSDQDWGSNGGSSAYAYDSETDTAYDGPAAESNYKYSERADAFRRTDGNYDHATPSGHHWGERYADNTDWHAITDHGTISPDGRRHNDGVEHREVHSGWSYASSDGWGFGWPTGSPMVQTRTEFSYDVQAWIDWVHDTLDEYGTKALDVLQTGLDVAQMVAPPGVGAALALANAGISYARGKEVDLRDLALALVPGVGAAAKVLGAGQKALGLIGSAERTILAEANLCAVGKGE